MRFTRDNIEGLSLPEGKADMIVFDDSLAGFGVRIRAGGKWTWIAQYKLGQKQRRMTLGNVKRLNVEGIGLDEARKRAKVALGKVTLGADPQTEKHAARQQASVTLKAIVPQYLAYAAPRQRASYHADVRRYLEQHWRPLAETPLEKISRADVALRLGKIAKERGPYSANRARASLSALFSWAIAEGLAASNPTAATNSPGEMVKRDRVLSDDELALVWRHAGLGDFGHIVRLLILTAARREEIGGAMWTEFDGEILRIAAARSKNGIPHDIPLSAPALAIIAGLSRREDRDLVFGSGAGPYQGWSNSKADLDARILDALKAERGAKAKLVPWRLHDLRRTAATRMGDLGVVPHVVEAVLGHISGSKAGVAGVYNRAAYLPEKRAALALWGERVQKTVNSSGD